jgi:hypothetical protein
MKVHALTLVSTKWKFPTFRRRAPDDEKLANFCEIHPIFVSLQPTEVPEIPVVQDDMIGQVLHWVILQMNIISNSSTSLIKFSLLFMCRNTSHFIRLKQICPLAVHKRILRLQLVRWRKNSGQSQCWGDHSWSGCCFRPHRWGEDPKMTRPDPMGMLTPNIISVALFDRL